MITLTIDGFKVSVPEGTPIIKAAEQAHVHVPRLCFMEGLHPYGACRVCCVEIEGEGRLAPSCAREAGEGMVVRTNSARVRQARQTIVELLMASHAGDCKSCVRNQTCELLKLAYQVGVEKPWFDIPEPCQKIDIGSPSLYRDPNKCVLCGRCIRVCSEIQTVHAVGFVNRGSNTCVSTYEEQSLGESPCTNCGQCIHVCPVGALSEVPAIEQVWRAILDPAAHTVVQTAPAVRASIGEALGLPPGTLSTGKMVSALRRIGFDKVFDTNFTADLTIMEEGTELVGRVKSGGTLPMITSCCPGWIKFMEHFYPDLMGHVSSCKSPQQMFGALAKTYYAEHAGLDPRRIVSVSIMPCTAKKFEAGRPEMCDSGFTDVDYVLTTRELARMVREMGLTFDNLPEDDADDPMGEYTGAATIFGATGGVMEAALRTGWKLITGKELENLDLTSVRGMEGVREAALSLPVNGSALDVRVAISHGLGHARTLLDQIRAGHSPYTFIEIMACPGGCVGGGGQPRGFKMETRQQRAEALYVEDASLPVRRSHENASVQGLYADYLSTPNSHRAHELLHTHYAKRKQF